jgi:hypothetical protein
MSSAAVENSVSDFDKINKTLTIYDNEFKVMTVRLISAVPDIGTFTEIYEVSNFEAYTPDSKLDFTARTDTKVGIGDVIGIEWFIEQNVSYVVTVTDYGIKEVEEIIFNNKTGKNETILVNRTVITGYHDETRYKDVWVDYQSYDKVMSKDQVQRIKVIYYKIPELGFFRIQTVPMFRGIECPELTWWSGSWDRRRAILIDNTVGDAVIDYQLKSVNLSSYNINASSSRIINETSGLEESFWNESVDASGNLEYVWCNFSSLPSGSWINSTYDIYYQSTPTASGVSDGDATFLLFDNFPGTSLDTNKWETATKDGVVSVSGGKLVLNPQHTTSQSGAGVIAVDSIPSGDYIIEATLKRVVSQNAGELGLLIGLAPKVTQDTTYYGFWDIADTAWGSLSKRSSTNRRYSVKYKTVDTHGDYSATAAYENIDVDVNVTYLQSSTKTIANFQFSGNEYEYEATDTGTITPLYPIIHYGEYKLNNYGYADNFRVRKYVANEPEPWTVGSEEEYPTPTPTPTPAPTTSISSAQYDELDLPHILYILMISLLYLLITFRHGVAAVELSHIYLIFAFFFLLFQTVTISVNYIYLTLFLLLFMISIAGITLEKRSW